MNMIELELVPRRAALLTGHDNTLEVLLLAKAPMAPATQRARSPLNLAIVIDRSGSMAGRPLAEAKRCAAMMIDGLAASDRASLVVYDNAVDVLVASRLVDNRELFLSALTQVDSRGSTDLHAGWLTGAEQAARGQGGDVLSRVLLLSDGCANHGITAIPDIARQCAQMAEAGVSTSTYGLGEGFNEELMTAMARAGQGNAYYGQTADDLADPFREELDLMSALCARGLRLSLAPASGVRVEVLNPYRTEADGRVQLPDLAYGGEAWAVLRLTVPSAVLEAGGSGDIHLLTASMAYTDVHGERGHAEPVHLRLPRHPAAVFAAIAENERVVRRVEELQAAHLQDLGRAAALAGDWARVEQLLSQLRVLAENNPWLAESVSALEKYARRRETQSFSKESHYSSDKMRHRMSSPNEGSEWSKDEEQSKPSYLRRKLEQGKRFGKPEEGPDGTQE
jgi:Ca-activated chloride channel family protein